MGGSEQDIADGERGNGTAADNIEQLFRILCLDALYGRLSGSSCELEIDGIRRWLAAVPFEAAGVTVNAGRHPVAEALLTTKLY